MFTVTGLSIKLSNTDIIGDSGIAITETKESEMRIDHQETAEEDNP